MDDFEAFDRCLSVVVDDFAERFPVFEASMGRPWRDLYLLSDGSDGDTFELGRYMLFGHIRLALFSHGHGVESATLAFRAFWVWLENIWSRFPDIGDWMFSSVCCLPAVIDWTARGYPLDQYLAIYPIDLHWKIQTWDDETFL